MSDPMKAVFAASMLAVAGWGCRWIINHISASFNRLVESVDGIKIEMVGLREDFEKVSELGKSNAHRLDGQTTQLEDHGIRLRTLEKRKPKP